MSSTRIRSVTLMAVLLVASAAQGVTFTPSPQVYCFNGHCYRSVGIPSCQCYVWEEVNAYARQGSHAGMPGHLLTIETSAELQWIRTSPLNSDLKILGALGGNNGPYTWVVGPSAGQSVTLFDDFLAAPYPGCGAAAGPFIRLVVDNVQYKGAGNRLATRACGLGSCADGKCGGMEHFVIEYEPDTVPPQAQTVFPNGGETLSGTVTFRWTATDAFGDVTGVDIHLSRTGPTGPFEEIALGLANSGRFDWVVTGPAAENSAYLRVTAHDTGGNTTSDLSNAAFSIEGTVAGRQTTWGAIKALYR